MYNSEDRETLSPIRAKSACVLEIFINDPSLSHFLVITYFKNPALVPVSSVILGYFLAFYVA